MIDVQITNLGEVRRTFDLETKKLYKAGLAKAIRPGARDFAKAVQARAPKDKGTIQRSITVKALKSKANVSYAGFFVRFKKNYKHRGKLVEPFYAFFVHNGTVVEVDENGKRVKKKRVHRKRIDFTNTRVVIKANPFVGDAFEAMAPQVATKILQNINDML
jgi:HK97 gp10 family phage protein